MIKTIADVARTDPIRFRWHFQVDRAQEIFLIDFGFLNRRKFTEKRA